ncbi:MAG: sugar phosphate isomerase/epimerase [Anaerolineae bacterium]
MADRVLLSLDQYNLEEGVALAEEYQLGVEVMAFAFPEVLDGNWEAEVKRHRALLSRLNGPITMHGPFMDMVSGSPDPRIQQVCMQRYKQAIDIAPMIGANLVNFHANYIGALHNVTYRTGWHNRAVKFWRQIAEYAREYDVMLVLENMWEFDPTILANLLQEVNHPNLLACLDIGHTYIFSDDRYTLQDWLETLRPWLIHTHMNNNNGVLDEHYAFDWENGVLDYNIVLEHVRALPYPPNIVLEMYTVEDMRNSLGYFEVGEPTTS